MSSSDAVTETLDEGGNGIAGRVGSLAKPLGPALAKHAESGTLAAASGVVSLVRAGRTFLKGNRKRGVLQALGGLFWVGVALAQRRTGRGSTAGATRGGPSTSDLADVADSSPDIEDVETEGTDADHATGEEVVDTTDADIEESDTAPEVESHAEGDVDQRDVVESGDLEDADADEESEAGSEDATEAGDVSEESPIDAVSDENAQAEPDGGTESDDEE
ncbi:hypothetical protein [Halorussus ruber]|uniref:hypothetical protein n=1 Tax=Halorussus ruber TaxID=1126238 RepID=UPI00109215B3|nr:hypothetical protein [Halorussus ruber]